MSENEHRRTGLSRREVLRTRAVAGAAAAFGGMAAAPASAAPAPGRPAGGRDDADLALVNGKIHTMDAENAAVSTVLIRRGRVLAVGDRAGEHGRRVVTINPHGRTVVPGIIANHNHIVLMSNRPGRHTPLENAYSIADVQQIYAERSAGIPAGAWITTIGGFHGNHLVPPDQPPRLPTLAELDDAVPDNPVYISEAFSGPSATNRLGKAFFAVTTSPCPTRT